MYWGEVARSCVAIVSEHSPSPAAATLTTRTCQASAHHLRPTGTVFNFQGSLTSAAGASIERDFEKFARESETICIKLCKTYSFQLYLHTETMFNKIFCVDDDE